MSKNPAKQAPGGSRQAKSDPKPAADLRGTTKKSPGAKSKSSGSTETGSSSTSATKRKRA